jgi:hypothetical protein
MSADLSARSKYVGYSQRGDKVAAYQSADKSAHSKELRAPLRYSPDSLHTFRQTIH